MTGSLSSPPVEGGKQSGVNGVKTAIRTLQLKEHVGFNSLPEQYVSRIVREGFVFNIMVVGPTGVGKTTLIDSLFNASFQDVSTKNHNMQSVEVAVTHHELQEKHIKMRLNVVETRGFGDQINKSMYSLL